MKKTHYVVKEPTIPVQYLADYMAASNQARRGIVRACKYKSMARTLQHQLARKIISDHILDGNPLPGDLADKAQAIRERVADSDFDVSIHEHNAEFVEAFANGCGGFQLVGFDFAAPMEMPSPNYNGTSVRFVPTLLTYRKTKVNTQKIGAIMLRYSKGKPVVPNIAEWQSAFMFGFFCESPFIEEAKPEVGLCRVLCTVSGNAFSAPSNSVYRFKEMKAVCGDIAERWENVPPPPNAVI